MPLGMPLGLMIYSESEYNATFAFVIENHGAHDLYKLLTLL